NPAVRGILDFDTGNFSSFSTPPNTYEFQPGGWFTIHGNIPGIGLNCAGAGTGVCTGADADGALLLSGSFGDPVDLENTSPRHGIINSALLGTGDDANNSAPLLNYFG